MSTDKKLAPKKQANFDADYKVIIVGESRIGKSSIIKRACKHEFSDETISTVGIDFVNLYYLIDGVNVKLQIWLVTDFFD
jgi:GTPase SAR1 family protein